MEDDTRALLEALERVREVRGSLPLYDALVRGDGAAFAAAVASHPRHPLKDAAVTWLGARGLALPPGPDVASRLLALGIEDVEAHVEAARRTERELRARVDELSTELAAARGAANAAALVCVLLGLLAAAGWAAVLGDLPFPRASDPPTMDEVREDAQERR